MVPVALLHKWPVHRAQPWPWAPVMLLCRLAGRPVIFVFLSCQRWAMEPALLCVSFSLVCLVLRCWRGEQSRLAALLASDTAGLLPATDQLSFHSGIGAARPWPGLPHVAVPSL